MVAPREQAAGSGTGPWRRLVGGAGRWRSSLATLVWGVESRGSLGLGNVGVEGGGPQRARGGGGTACRWQKSGGARRRRPGLGTSGGHCEGCGVLGLENVWAEGGAPR